MFADLREPLLLDGRSGSSSVRHFVGSPPSSFVFVLRKEVIVRTTRLHPLFRSHSVPPLCQTNSLLGSSLNDGESCLVASRKCTSNPFDFRHFDSRFLLLAAFLRGREHQTPFDGLHLGSPPKMQAAPRSPSVVLSLPRSPNAHLHRGENPRRTRLAFASRSWAQSRGRVHSTSVSRGGLCGHFLAELPKRSVRD